ncbi:MAG: DUF3306 domain-containing protein [Geminicoccaceae bacterium]
MGKASERGAGSDQDGPGPKTLENPSTDEGFLGRWSRRKAEARAPDDNASADLPVDQETPPSATDTEQVDQPPPTVDPASLPDIDKMEAGSDFSVFMQAGVPRELKTKALRKLWRVKPELANLDGLIDYGEDLTGSFKVVDHLKTAYEVGKGFLKDEEAQEEGQIASEAKHDAANDRTITEDEEKPDEIDRMTENHDADPPIARNDAHAAKNSKG